MKKHLSCTAPALVLAGFLLSCIPALARATSSEPPVEILHLAGNDPCGLFGFSAGGVGDFNGDGYQDFAVSEPFGSGVHVYWGGPNADSLADLHLRDGGYGLLGFLTASAGDFNGDGFDAIVAALSRLVSLVARGDGVADIIVSSLSGLRVYYGGPGLDGLEDFRLTVSQIDGQRMAKFAPAGDVNGDGAGDIMVATADQDGLQGRVQIYFGGAQMDSIPDVTLHAQDPAGMFGPAMTNLGDTNGDGYAELIVRAPLYDRGQTTRASPSSPAADPEVAR